MLHDYHKCYTNGTCNVFLWQSSSKHQIIWIKKVKAVLLKSISQSLSCVEVNIVYTLVRLLNL